MEISLTSSDMEDYVIFMQKFSLIMPLESIFPELIEERKKAQDIFANSVVKELRSINKTYDLLKNGMETKLQNLQELENLRTEVLDCDPGLAEYNKAFNSSLSDKVKAIKMIKQYLNDEEDKFKVETKRIENNIRED